MKGTHVCIELRSQIIERVERSRSCREICRDCRDDDGDPWYHDQNPVEGAMQHAEHHGDTDQTERKHAAHQGEDAGNEAMDNATTRSSSLFLDKRGVVREMISDEFRVPEHR